MAMCRLVSVARSIKSETLKGSFQEAVMLQNINDRLVHTSSIYCSATLLKTFTDLKPEFNKTKNWMLQLIQSPVILHFLIFKER